MNLFYLGNSCFENNVQQELLDRQLISINATQKREKYIFFLLFNSKVIQQFNFVSFGLGYRNGIFRKVTSKNAQYTSTFLGYMGIGKFKYLSGFFTASIFLLSKVKSGDILISYNLQPGYAIAIGILKLFKRVTFIIEFEDFFNKTDFRYYFTSPFERFGMMLADQFIASSVGMQNYLKRKEPKKQCIVHSGYRYLTINNINKHKKIDKTIKRSFHQNQSIKILYSGSLTKTRGVLDLIDIFLAKASSQFELIITGQGPLKNYVLEKTTTNSNIKYYGLLSDCDYEELLNRVNICVNSQRPSIKLNFPSKITEYLSHGKILMSTKGSSVLKSEFSSLIHFYDYADPVSFWDVIHNDIISNLSTKNMISKSFNNIYDKMDKRLINQLSLISYKT